MTGGPVLGEVTYYTGGYRVVRGGEVDLARFGALVLQDLTLWRTDAIDALGRRLASWPPDAGRPIIVATSAPCACGWLGRMGPTGSCECTSRSHHLFTARLAQFCSILGISESVVMHSGEGI